ncbi:3-oxoacyl-reductase [Ascobolus immersus RN42]|uniref:3-oxoacyl-reductase n=1 Tax=Ascobolus immersus RN42 TaxID=1160509 RepID=A0A3N4HIA6_ASCIM|nr:3-oxoacyl-reductase [Ascobolus immersus RN42]
MTHHFTFLCQVRMMDKQTTNERLDQVAGHLRPIKQLGGPSTGRKLTGKVAILTGANAQLGIGRATAYLFAEHGCRAVYICDVDGGNLEGYVKDLAEKYPEVEVHARTFDASNEAAVKSVIDEAIERYGRLDIFFANAGIVGAVTEWGTPKEMEDITPDDFLRTVKINTLSVFLAIKHASAAMSVTSSSKPHPGGSIVATSSVAGLRAGAGGYDYSASKAAIVSLIQTTACSPTIRGKNIRINSINPGLIETGMTSPVFEMARARGTEGKVGQLNPLARAGCADEVARAVTFLASDESSYVNGQSIAVDGGLSASLPVALRR